MRASTGQPWCGQPLRGQTVRVGLARWICGWRPQRRAQLPPMGPQQHRRPRGLAEPVRARYQKYRYWKTGSIRVAPVADLHVTGNGIPLGAGGPLRDAYCLLALWAGLEPGRLGSGKRAGPTRKRKGTGRSWRRRWGGGLWGEARAPLPRGRGAPRRAARAGIRRVLAGLDFSRTQASSHLQLKHSFSSASTRERVRVGSESRDYESESRGLPAASTVTMARTPPSPRSAASMIRRLGKAALRRSTLVDISRSGLRPAMTSRPPPEPSPDPGTRTRTCRRAYPPAT